MELFLIIAVSIVLPFFVLTIAIYGVYKYFVTKKERYLLPFFMMFVFFYISKYEGVKELLFASIYVQNTLMLYGIFLFFLLFKKWLYFSVILGSLITMHLLFVPMIVMYVEEDIKKVAIEKYGIEPSYIDINLNIDEEIRHPHAVLYIENKTYYWSFREKDFVLNTNPLLKI
jgi:hypothetical protein